MSGTLRVINADELELIAGGSMQGAGDVNYMAPQSEWLHQGVPVYNVPSTYTQTYVSDAEVAEQLAQMQQAAGVYDYSNTSSGSGSSSTSGSTGSDSGGDIIVVTASAPSTSTNSYYNSFDMLWDYYQMANQSGAIDPNTIVVTATTSSSSPIEASYHGMPLTMAQLQALTNSIANGHSDFFDYFPTGPNPAFPSLYEDKANQLDAEVDRIASEVAAIIRGLDDSNVREYGAIIYVTADGVVKVGPLIKGQTYYEANPPAIDFGTNLPNLEGGAIVALVHSHPDDPYNATQDLMHQYPSHPDNGGGDYLINQNFVHTNSLFESSNVFAHYILGPDGILREFNASHGEVTHSNDPGTIDWSDLSYDR